MAQMKQYGLEGIASNVQLGKKGGRLKYDSTGQTIQFKNVADDALIRVKGATPSQVDDLTTKQYVDTINTTLDTRITTEKDTLNTRITTEVGTLNSRIDTEVATLNTRVDGEVLTLNNSITEVDRKYDGMLQGLDTKKAVDVATFGQNVTLTGTTPLVIDGITLVNGMRVLLKDQTDAKENGIYTVSITGMLYELARSDDANNVFNGEVNSEVRSGLFTFVSRGTENGGSGWTLTSPKGPVTLGTDNIQFTQFSYAGVISPGAAMSKNGTTLNVNVDDLFITVNGQNKLTIKANSEGKIITTDNAGNTVWKTFDLADSHMVGTSILNIANGGTGLSAPGANGTLLQSNGTSLAWGTLNLASANSVGTSILGVVNGGTGKNSVASGSLLYGNSSNGYNEVNIGAAGRILTSDGGKPYWTTLDLSTTASVGSSILNTANGGTGFNTFTQGDLMYGNVSGSLSKLGVGTNDQYLVSDGTKPVWRTIYNDDLKNATDGSVILNGIGVDTPVNRPFVKNAQAGNSVEFGSEGSDAHINITISPQGNGLLVAKAGYAFNATSPGLAFAPKSYVDERVDAISTSRIQNTATTTFFDSQLSGYDNKAAIGSNGKVVQEVLGSTDSATQGERLRVTHTDGEVHLAAVNTVGTGNVHLRLLPQNSGNIYVGVTGDGLIQAEPGYTLKVKGGTGTSSLDGGDLLLEAGDATLDNTNGGSVIVRPGVPSGSGVSGNIQFLDDEQNNILILERGTSLAQNYLKIKNAGGNVDPTVSAVKLIAEGVSGDISFLLDPKGNGLVRVADSTTYYNALLPVGNNDALVNKQYVLSQVSGSTKYAGVGLTEDTNTFNVNVGATTIKTDSSDNIIVSSSASAGQVLISTGIAGQEATWANIDLTTGQSLSGVLPTTKGGTGFTSFTPGDILIGGLTGDLQKVTKGANSQFLGVSSGGAIAYSYVSNLRDNNGNVVMRGDGATSPVNFLTGRNANLNGAVELGSDGQNNDISIILAPKGNGLVVAKAGYTANLTSGVSSETVVTKGYVDNLAQMTTPAGVRRVTITSGQNTFNLGAALPSIAGRQVFVTRVFLNVTTPFSGDGVEQCAIVAGVNTFMSFDENDCLAVGPYVAVSEMGADVSGQQLTLNFYKADGTTLATPTSGNAVVTVDYTIM